MWNVSDWLSFARATGGLDGIIRPVLLLFLIGVAHRRIHLCRRCLQGRHRKGAALMSTHTVPIEAHSRRSRRYSPIRSATRSMPHTTPNGKPTDSSSAVEPFCSCGSMWLNFSLAHRPIANRYIRIDEMGRAQAIQYSDLNYSPREGEVRTYLTDWANYRYTINRDTIAKKYPLNYYFLSQTLASQLMTEDNQNHLVSQVIAGQIEQSDVEVRNVTITSMSEETVQGAAIARGTALVTIDRLYSPEQFPRAPHGTLAAHCHLLPESQAGQRSGKDLSPVRDHQSAGIDDHRVPRKPRVRRSHCAGNAAPQRRNPAKEDVR